VRHAVNGFDNVSEISSTNSSSIRVLTESTPGALFIFNLSNLHLTTSGVIAKKLHSLSLSCPSKICFTDGSWFLAHSMNELMQSRGARRPSVCLSVNFYANRYFYHEHDSIATKLAHDGPHMGLHPGCAQGQGKGQRSRDTDTFLITRKSLLLQQTYPDRHQTCTWWSPHRPASRVCSRSRSRSKVTWYGHFCDVTKCWLYSTFWRSVSTCIALPLRSTVTLSLQYKCQTARFNVYIMEWATPSLTVWLFSTVNTDAKNSFKRSPTFSSSLINNPLLSVNGPTLVLTLLLDLTYLYKKPACYRKH